MNCQNQNNHQAGRPECVIDEGDVEFVMTVMLAALSKIKTTNNNTINTNKQHNHT